MGNTLTAVDDDTSELDRFVGIVHVSKKCLFRNSARLFGTLPMTSSMLRDRSLPRYSEIMRISNVHMWRIQDKIIYIKSPLVNCNTPKSSLTLDLQLALRLLQLRLYTIDRLQAGLGILFHVLRIGHVRQLATFRETSHDRLCLGPKQTNTTLLSTKRHNTEMLAAAAAEPPEPRSTNHNNHKRISKGK